MIMHDHLHHCLPRNFYLRSTERVAEDLLGCLLVRVLADGRILSGRISETEAYIGEWDTACHTSSGKTERNRVMYGPGGLAYVYFVYGLHNMLNVVTEREGKGCAVLIRGVIPEEGTETMIMNRGGKMPLTDGPARLTQAFQITREHNGLDLVTSRDIFITPGYREASYAVIRTPRIGIDYAAEKDKKALLRFVLRTGLG
ncbi:MAG: DNA-3-methyladenine glycosylase [Fidelibacterota bacterium]